MMDLIRKAFDTYGMHVSVQHAGDTVQTKAFIQPLTAENKDEPFSVAPLGAADERCWRYLGPGEVCVEMGDKIVWRGKSYVARRASGVYVGEETAYYWAVLHEEEAASV